jgi:hypothetical protein
MLKTEANVIELARRKSVDIDDRPMDTDSFDVMERVVGTPVKCINVATGDEIVYTPRYHVSPLIYDKFLD